MPGVTIGKGAIEVGGSVVAKDVSCGRNCWWESNKDYWFGRGARKMADQGKSSLLYN